VTDLGGPSHVSEPRGPCTCMGTSTRTGRSAADVRNGSVPVLSGAVHVPVHGLSAARDRARVRGGRGGPGTVYVYGYEYAYGAERTPNDPLQPTSAMDPYPYSAERT